MNDDHAWQPGPDDLVVPFVFMPHGAPEPTEWMAEHPGWVKFSATLVWRESGTPAHREPPAFGLAAAAAAAPAGGTASEAAPVLTGMGEGLAELLGTSLAAAALGLTGGAAVALYPSQAGPDRFDEIPRESRRRSQPDGKAGFDQPPALSAPPGLTPPGDAALPPHQGIAPVSPLPRHPGFAPAPPVPALPPDNPAAEPGPTVFHQDRNDGLHGGLRTNSQRAREAARKADPIVPETLQDAEWEAHHLINLEAIRNDSDLLAAAADAGWRTDDAGNVTPLPATHESQRKLGSAGVTRPLHDSGHREWNAYVRDGLREIKKQLAGERLSPASEAYARRARKLLEELQNRLRDALPDHGRLTSIAPNHDRSFA